ncbi:hypothetical protein COHA_004669 [Chlorella ohadii]|uniref:DOT1 domain-containing protein n=1 Tax=Chlorella ohadii TaxID=2649997 RepID=A0AAD5DWL1_9CHLO|nr:hypothetical protein COHA_004669 [Chlorella ohadii]
MTAPAGGAAAAPADARLRALYSVMQSIENKLGGGEGVEGLYGSIKRSGMDKVLECMRARCGLDGTSVMVDVGAGLGRPLMHALLEPGIAGARGIEIDRIKCDKAAAFLKQAVAELQRRGVADTGLVPPPIECSAIENVCSLDPCTHAYSFWEGVPVDGKAAFGRLFAASRTLRSVAVVQRAIRTDPAEYMADLGFGEVELVSSFSVSMSGSGRSFTAYVFNKANMPAGLPAPLAAEQAAAQSVQTPALAAEAAAPVPTVQQHGVAAAALAESEDSVQSSAAIGGRRQRRPTAKQAAAEEQAAEEAQVQRQRSARAQRADRRTAAASEAAAATASQQAAAAPAVVQQHEAGEQAVPAAAAAPDSPSRHTRLRGAASGTTAVAAASAAAPAGSPGKGSRAAATAAAAKLSSPQKGGVQKRSSPAKPAKAAVVAVAAGAAAGAPVRTSPRKLALSLAMDEAAGSKASKAAPAASVNPLAAARVVKSGTAAQAAAKLRTSPRKQAAAAVAPRRRGLAQQP